MLDTPSCLIPRELSASCEREGQWIYNAFHVFGLCNKRRSVNSEDAASKKAAMSIEITKRRGLLCGLHLLSMMQVDKHDNIQNGVRQEEAPCTHSGRPINESHNQSHYVEGQLDSSSLIHPLGRELSISCLLHCSSLLEWEAFDPVCRRWMHLPIMTSNECFRCSDKESLAVGTELLVFGKEITSHVIYRYSILTNTWTCGTKMNAPRCLFGSASLGEIAILAGGCDPFGNVLSSAELYNSETGTWVTIPSMNKARKMCSGVFMDDKFYIIGGIGEGNTSTLTCGEVYDLKTRSWCEIPNIFPGRNANGTTESSAATEAPPLVAVVNQELYAADYAQKEVRKYNKRENMWITLGRLPEQAVSMNGWGLAFRACGDRLIVIGGPRTLGGGMIELNSWVPSQGPPQWDLLARKPSGSFVYNCAVMGC